MSSLPTRLDATSGTCHARCTQYIELNKNVARLQAKLLGCNTHQVGTSVSAHDARPVLVRVQLGVLRLRADGRGVEENLRSLLESCRMHGHCKH